MKLEYPKGFENGTNNQQGCPCTLKILLTFMYLYFVHRNDIASTFYDHERKLRAFSVNQLTLGLVLLIKNQH